MHYLTDLLVFRRRQSSKSARESKERLGSGAARRRSGSATKRIVITADTGSQGKAIAAGSDRAKVPRDENADSSKKPPLLQR